MTKSITTFTFDTDSFSDLHKDAFGFRPRDHRFYAVDTTDEEKQEIYDYTCEELEREFARIEQAEIEADLGFESLILDCLNMGASDRKTAIRWILESEEMDEFDAAYGFSFVTWKLGISDKYREEVLAVIESIIAK